MRSLRLGVEGVPVGGLRQVGPLVPWAMTATKSPRASNRSSSCQERPTRLCPSSRSSEPADLGGGSHLVMPTSFIAAVGGSPGGDGTGAAAPRACQWSPGTRGRLSGQYSPKGPAKATLRTHVSGSESLTCLPTSALSVQSPQSEDLHLTCGISSRHR